MPVKKNKCSALGMFGYEENPRKTK